MGLLVTALIGAGLSLAFSIAIARATGRRMTTGDYVAAALAGAVTGLTVVGLLRLLAPAAAGVTGARAVTVFAGAGAAGGATDQLGHNVAHERPLLEGVPTATTVGAAAGAAPLAVAPVVRPLLAKLLPRPEAAAPARGLVQVLEDAPPPRAEPTAPAAPTRPVPARAVGVHPAPPGWLQARWETVLQAVREGRAGPEARVEDVRAFLQETWEHVREVNALVRRLGGRARDLPATPPPGEQALRGIHDLGERASLRRVEELIAKLRREPLRDREGVPLEVPDWLARLPREARARGETTLDVGKLAPWIAAGLGRAGRPDPFALALHRLSAHHQQVGARAAEAGSAALIEEVADVVNALRQVRVYRPQPVPWVAVERILLADVQSGQLPEAARPLIARAIEAQRQLEREGLEVTPYYLLE